MWHYNPSPTSVIPPQPSSTLPFICVTYDTFIILKINGNQQIQLATKCIFIHWKVINDGVSLVKGSDVTPQVLEIYYSKQIEE